MNRIFHAYAKTNLFLRVLGRRNDGYHEIETRMCRVSLADELLLDVTEGDGVAFERSDTSIPAGEDNLVMRAVRAFERRTGKGVGGTIRLKKRIPSGAGLGGGSIDAAATILGLNHLLEGGLTRDDMKWIGGEVGSDIPFFIHEDVCDCSGRGDNVEPIDYDWELPIVLVKPAFGIKSGWAYSRWEGAREIRGVRYAPQLCYWGAMVNDLERPVFEKHLVMAQMKMWLLEQEESHAVIMSGSGSTMLVILATVHGGEALVSKVKTQYGEGAWTFVGNTVPSRRGVNKDGNP